ncbi:MAG: hypothetical protein H6675_01780 [Dehalococcoidia bacterium]|nr:hypothetical protein [Dehalococcoidia bacterium]
MTQDVPASATPTRTQVGTTPTIEPTPSGTATETPSATPADEGEVGWGVVTVEVATGDVATLYEGPDTFRPGLGLAFAPWPEARNGGIWVSPTTDESTRYNLDGESVASVPGWGHRVRRWRLAVVVRPKRGRRCQAERLVDGG